MTEKMFVGMRSVCCVAAVLLAGCNSIIGLPVAVSQNTFIGLRGQIVDERGVPADGVEVRAVRRHILWDPAGGGTRDVPDTATFRTNHTLDIWPRRAFQISYTFSKPGYADAGLTAYQSGYQLAMESSVVGSMWPLDSRVTIVLATSQPPARRSFIVTYIPLGPESESSVEMALGIELHAKITGRESLALWFADHKPGFVAVHPDLAAQPLAHLKEAPASGYSPELVLRGERLNHFIDLENVMVPERNLFFYFYAGSRYGKAMISMPRGYEDTETSLRVTYLLQPDGTRDVSDWERP